MNTLYKTMLIGGEDVDVEIDYKISMNGIGAYECHGYKGYDAGSPEAEVVEVRRADNGKVITTDPEIEAAIEGLVFDCENHYGEQEDYDG